MGLYASFKDLLEGKIMNDEFIELLGAAENELMFLNCLRNAGVDNWEGYDYAIEMYHSEEDDYY